MAPESRYLAVPPTDEPLARGLGAEWDAGRGSWFVPDGVPVGPFARWMEPGEPGRPDDPGPELTAGPEATGGPEGADPARSELAGRARPEFPAEAFAPLPAFVPGHPPEIDPAVAEQVFRSVERPAVRKRPDAEGPPSGPLSGPSTDAGAPAVDAGTPRPDPVPDDGSIAVRVAGITKRCYRCGGETRVVAGILVPLPNDDVDEPPANSPWRRRTTPSGRDLYRYVPLPAVAATLAEALDAGWCRRYDVAPIRQREMDPEYRFTGDDAGLANGCVHCDAMLKDQPIQDAFEEAIGPDLRYDDFVVGTARIPESCLPPEAPPG